MLNGVLLSIINIYRNRSIKSNVVVIEVMNYIFSIFTLITLLEDQELAGLASFARSPHIIACAVFIFLYASLKQFVRLVI